MTSLRPVTSHWPYSSSLWDETSLPLSLVVTPLHDLGETTTKAAKNEKLSSIPKCLHCGAPHPPSSNRCSHDARILRNAILCYLCGKTSSTLFSDQAAARPEEQLQRDDYYSTRDDIAVHSTGSSRTTIFSQDFAMPLYEHVFSLPAHVCPPVYWIMVDGSTDHRSYWSTIGNVLQRVTEDVPPYVHVGLLVAQAQSLSIWDLHSPVPHIRHIPWPLPVHLQLPLHPASSFHLPAALRALADHATTTGTKQQQQQQDGMPLGATLEAILDTLQMHSHPGQAESSAETPPTYAGGKVLCLLAGPPVEVGRKPTPPPLLWKKSHSELQSHGMGGWGGTCAEPGRRFAQDNFVGGAAAASSTRTAVSTTNNQDGDEEVDPELGTKAAPTQISTASTLDNTTSNDHHGDDMTPSALSRHYPATSLDHVETYFADLGAQCAEAALAVDIIALYDHALVQESSFGLPLLRSLSDRSGAPGPLLFDLQDPTQRLERELLARTPWHRPMGYGVCMRLRLSSGFLVDAAPVEPSLENGGPQLAPTYASGGCLGPATAIDEVGLWSMGTCDDTTTMAVDLNVTHARDHVRVEDCGDVMLLTALQTCVAYTTIVPNEDDGSFVTVRRMRVTSRPMPLARDAETLYESVDAEALAVVLFHKLSIASLQDGLMETREIGQSWLKSLLLRVYRSAEKQMLRQQANAEYGVLDKRGNTLFLPQERLLNHPGGMLTAEQVLLAEGHERLRPIVLLVFALLQCDALRPSSGSFQPSLEARCAASAQLYSMPPNVLVRCVASRLELWSDDSGENEPIQQNVNLNLNMVKLNVKEHWRGESSLALLLDSPRELLVLNGGHFLEDDSDTFGAASEFGIGEGLRQSIDQALKSYRVPPPVEYALTDKRDESNGELKCRLLDALVEDSEITVMNEKLTYSQWKSEVAALVYEEIEHPEA